MFRKSGHRFSDKNMRKIGRPKDGGAALAHSRPKDGVASLA
jgi:hypothetical protein